MLLLWRRSKQWLKSRHRRYILLRPEGGFGEIPFEPAVLYNGVAVEYEGVDTTYGA